MTTPNSLKEKLTSTAEVLIRERLNVLAAVLASTGAATDRQHLLLDRLVTAIRDAILVPAISDVSGVPIPVAVDFEEESNDSPVIKFNQSMLSSVGDITEDMLIDTLVKPIAKILGLPVATIAIVLHERDEERIRELSVKLAGMVEGEVINFSSLKSVQEILLKRFLHRIAHLCTLLSGGLEVTTIKMSDPGVSELLERIATFPRWPSWDVVRGSDAADLTAPYSQPLNQVVQHTCKALHQTPWASDGMKIIKSIWNCSDLGQRSFLIEVARSLRSEDVKAPANVLMAVAEAVGSDTRDLSLRLEDWPRFDELQNAMEQLYRTESAYFGTACESQGQKKPVSVVDISERAFGLKEPDELPWDVPLLCWTQRETDALRDIFLGKCKTTYGTTARDSCRRTYDFSWHNAGESELRPNLLEKTPKMQLIPVGNLDVNGLADALNVGAQPTELSSDTGQPVAKKFDSVVEHCWKAAFKVLQDHFEEVPRGQERHDLIVEMRRFYNDIAPEMKEAWDRRFASLSHLNGRRAFSTLCRELAYVIGKPCLIDPFKSVENSTLAEKPRLVFICTIEKNSDISVAWIPLSLITATPAIGNLYIRLIEEVPSNSDDTDEPEEKGSFLWLRDVPLHVDLLAQHSLDRVMPCIYGDAVQIVLNK